MKLACWQRNELLDTCSSAESYQTSFEQTKGWKILQFSVRKGGLQMQECHQQSAYGLCTLHLDFAFSSRCLAMETPLSLSIVCTNASLVLCLWSPCNNLYAQRRKYVYVCCFCAAVPDRPRLMHATTFIDNLAEKSCWISRLAMLAGKKWLTSAESSTLNLKLVFVVILA